MNKKGILVRTFIGVFILGLLFPNTGLFRGRENARIVARENRRITAFPKNSWKEKSFYSNFEKWYQDRLRYRDKAIKRWRTFNARLGVILSDKIFRGQNRWLFNRNNVVQSFEYKEEKAIALQKLQAYCLANGAQFAFLLAPPKEAIYDDYFPASERQKYKDYDYWEAQVKESLRRRGVRYISVTDAFKAARRNDSAPLYFHDDHHWSYYGAALASKLVLEDWQTASAENWYAWIGLDTKKQHVFKECSYAHELGYGQTREIDAPWSAQFTDEIYAVDCNNGQESKMKKIVSNDYLWGKIMNGEGIIKNKKLNNKKTILILGDSYSSYMAPYLSQYLETFISTHYSRGKKNVDMAELLAKYKPDYVLLEMLGNSFYRSKDVQRIGKIVISD